jgi:hypothetical protein
LRCLHKDGGAACLAIPPDFFTQFYRDSPRVATIVIV